MFNHCKLYSYSRGHLLLAVSLILLGILHFPVAKAEGSNISSIAVLGDSMTWIGGDSCENPTGWTHTLKQSRIFNEIDIFARSGATWTNTSSTVADTSFYSEILHDNNVIYNQALRLIETYGGNGDKAPDCIMVFAGANDAWFSEKRPGIFSNTDSICPYKNPLIVSPDSVTSLYGCVSLVCDMLQYTFPDAGIILVTPLQMSKIPASSTFKVADIIEKAGLSRGCMVLRADIETAVSHDDEVKHNKYTYDGVHTNPEGAELVGHYILNNLKQIINLQTE